WLRVLGLDLEEHDLCVPPGLLGYWFVGDAADHLLDGLYSDRVRHDAGPAVGVIEDMSRIVTVWEVQDLADDGCDGRARQLQRELAVLELILDELHDVRQVLASDNNPFATRLRNRCVCCDDVTLVVVSEIGRL